MNMRHLAFLIALEQERHFGRAAAACNVTQPTLSGALRQLETELGVPIVERGRKRFIGFTAEGARILKWARAIVADGDGLRRDLEAMRGALTGRLRLGVIPAAMPTVAFVTDPLCRRHPGVSVTVLSHTSHEIEAGIEAYRLDAGLTYLGDGFDDGPGGGPDDALSDKVRQIPLYRERYVLLTPAGGPFEDRPSVTWREAATLPMCLLTPDMQNRRIIDRLFASVGAGPRVRIDTNSFVAIHAYVRSGGWSTVVPHTFLHLLGGPAGVRRLPLVEPRASQALGLVVPDREPQSPIVEALIKAVRRCEIAAEIERFVAQELDS